MDAEGLLNKSHVVLKRFPRHKARAGRNHKRHRTLFFFFSKGPNLRLPSWRDTAGGQNSPLRLFHTQKTAKQQAPARARATAACRRRLDATARCRQGTHAAFADAPHTPTLPEKKSFCFETKAPGTNRSGNTFTYTHSSTRTR